MMIKRVMVGILQRQRVPTLNFSYYTVDESFEVSKKFCILVKCKVFPLNPHLQLYLRLFIQLETRSEYK